MHRGQYNPPRDGVGPCWHCQHFDGLTCGGAHALCGRPGTSRLTAAPASGCVYFVLVPGVDALHRRLALGRRGPAERE